ncbi:MAG: biotin--[acetyl-CoA-carboxylase] ligase, partial [Gammaproteobacteria bacterium]|nr:biotin--[acetyl-CoA-carboxylase] ligase [Gammaproteobacteria bacterium]
AVRGRGYRLPGPVELLDARRIRQGLDPVVAATLSELEIFFRIASTNDHLKSAHGIQGRAALAEIQTAGRGRRGSRWISPPCTGMCLSVGWRFDPPPESLMLLSLLSGAAMLRALQNCGVAGVSVKWPNDLVRDGKKLGGILIESSGQVAGAVDVVLGVGINVRLPGEALAEIDQPATDLAGPDGSTPSRNRLAAEALNALVKMLLASAAGAYAPYLDEWRKHDAGRGKNGCLRLPGREIRGRIVDIDPAGMLIMRVDGRMRKFSSGELSLRIAS